MQRVLSFASIFNHVVLLVSFCMSFFAMLAGARSDVFFVTPFARELWLFLYTTLFIISLVGFTWWRFEPTKVPKVLFWKTRPDLDTLFMTNIAITLFIASGLLFESIVERNRERLEILTLHLICFMAVILTSFMTTLKIFLFHLNEK